MAIPIVQFGAVIKCPHGGAVTPAGGNPRVRAGGQPILMVAGAYVVAGCPFTVPSPAGPKPQPCVRAQWQTGAARARAGGQFLVKSSIGQCFSIEGIMQGPAIITLTQIRAGAT